MPFFALGLFGGLRSGEIMGMDSNDSGLVFLRLFLQKIRVVMRDVANGTVERGEQSSAPIHDEKSWVGTRDRKLLAHDWKLCLRH